MIVPLKPAEQYADATAKVHVLLVETAKALHAEARRKIAGVEEELEAHAMLALASVCIAEARAMGVVMSLEAVAGFMRVAGGA